MVSLSPDIPADPLTAFTEGGMRRNAIRTQAMSGLPEADLPELGTRLSRLSPAQPDAGKRHAPGAVLEPEVPGPAHWGPDETPQAGTVMGDPATILFVVMLVFAVMLLATWLIVPVEGEYPAGLVASPIGGD
jgi:hypothetical protein